MVDKAIWEDDPLCLVDHVRHLFVEELAMKFGGLVGPALHRGVTPGSGPRGGALLGGGARDLEVVKVAGGRMV
jgi:hypothetical protein